jgi:2'-5' RNA ligase
MLAAVRNAVSDADPSWRTEKWVPARNLHITLAFIPDLPRSEIDHVLEATRSHVTGSRTFHLPFDRVRSTPRARRARMLWATFADPDGHGARLADAVRAAVSDHLAEEGPRAFRPHVTLCRARRPHAIAPAALDSASALLRASLESVSVSSATLYASTLGPGGPTYDPLGLVPLEDD